MHPFVQAAMLGAAGRPQGVVTLTAQVGGPPPMASSIGMDQSGTALWRFGANGTVTRIDNDTGTNQVNASTDWIIPNNAASGLYELKWDQAERDAPTGGTSLPAEGVWTSLGSNIDIGAFATFGQFEEGMVTVSIRFNGGPVLDSANFEWQAIGTDD